MLVAWESDAITRCEKHDTVPKWWNMAPLQSTPWRKTPKNTPKGDSGIKDIEVNINKDVKA
jgi:hypothetical protein